MSEQKKDETMAPPKDTQPVETDKDVTMTETTAKDAAVDKDQKTPATEKDANGVEAAKEGKATKVDPADVKHAPRPDKAAKDAKISKIEERINEVQKLRSKYDRELDIIRKKNAPEKKILDGLREEIQELNKKKEVLLRERTALRDRQNLIKQVQKARKDEFRKFKEKNRYSTLEDIDREISRLVDRQKTETLTLKQDKDLIKSIESLKADRKKLEEFKKSMSASEGSEEKDAMASTSEALKAKNDELTVLFDQINLKLTERRELKEKNDKDRSAVNGLYEKLQKTKEQLNKAYDEKRAVLKEFKEQNDAHFAYRRAQQEIRKAKEQELLAEEKKKYEEELKKKEEEELKKKPWQEEMALCDFLINYLKKLLAKETKKTEDASVAAKSNGEAVPQLEGFEGMKVSQKKKDNEENFMVMGGGSKKKKTKAKRKEKNETITHSLDLLSSFSLLSLTAPNKASEIDASIASLQEKKAYYDVLPRAPKKTDSAKSAKVETSEAPKAKKNKPKKVKVNAPSMESSDLFPSLPGSKSPKAQPVVPPSGPTAVDLIKSYDDLHVSDPSQTEKVDS